MLKSGWLESLMLRCFIAFISILLISMGLLSTASAQVVTAPIRIELDTTLIDAVGLAPADRALLDNAVNQAVQWAEETLSVIPMTDPISYSGGGCTFGGPSVVSGNVTGADFVLVLVPGTPNAAPFIGIGGTNVAGSTCLIAPAEFDRPVVGGLLINVDPFYPPFSSSDDYLASFRHELIHALVFDSFLFDRYREGLEGPPRGSAVTTSYIQNGATVTAVTTPAVVAAAQEQFDCPTLIGAELENQGEGALSHWEERTFPDELMHPVQGPGLGREVVSAVTLALFEDSGWYEVDYSKAGTMSYGHGLGCEIAVNSCDAYPALYSDEYFCSAPAEGPSHDGDFVGYCGVIDYGVPLPPEYQYFSDPALGGSLLADFCPRFSSLPRVCADPAATGGPLEFFGPGSKAFRSGASSEAYPSTTSLCHESICGAGVLSIRVGAEWLDCPVAGGRIDFPGSAVAVECPRFGAYCSTCGDGVATIDEGCDDGGTVSGDGCSATCQVEPASSACGILRWRFDHSSGESAVDGTAIPESACGLDGQVRGAGASFTGDAIDLPGGASGSGAAYVDLPNGIVSSLSDATFEAWYTPTGIYNWMRVFDFGTTTNGEVPPNVAGNGQDYLFYSAARFGDVNLQRTEMSTSTGFYREDPDLLSTLGQGYHVAVVFESEGAGPGLHQITTYRDGVPIAQGTSTSPLADVNDVNNWLGRSNFGGDGFFEGTIEEFRLYDQSLEWGEVLYSIQQGADVADIVVPEPRFGVALIGAAGVLVTAARRRRRAAGGEVEWGDGRDDRASTIF
ncbi:MAG: leishmanolysin-related zinc metalloendopeptidase [Myxococcota bacterium]